MGCNCNEQSPLPNTDPIILGWQIWYVGGLIYRSSEYSWAELPNDGVLALSLCESTCAPDGKYTRQLLSGYDYYFLAGDIFGANNDAPEITAQRYRGAVIKRGKWTTTAEMSIVTSAMVQERFLWLNSRG